MVGRCEYTLSIRVVVLCLYSLSIHLKFNRIVYARDIKYSDAFE